MNRLLLSTTFLTCFTTAASADPVTASLALVLGGGATALAIAQVVVGLGINLVAAALSKALAPKPKVNVNFEAQVGDDLPLSFIVGDYVTAGKRKYVGSWGPNTRYIVEVFEVSSLPQPGNPELWINDEPAEILWGTIDTFTDRVVNGREQKTRDGHSGGGTYYVNTYATVTTPLGSPITNYKKDDTGYRLWIKWVDGSQTVADPYLRSVFGNHPDHPYDVNMIGKGKSYAIITTRYDSDTMTSLPNILFKPAPLPLYDPRKDTTVGGSGTHRWGTPSTYQASRNAAVIAYNIARGIYYNTEWVFGGQDLAAWRLPVTEWALAMNACDALISLADASTEPSFRCGAEITVDMEPLTVLEQLGLAANMRFAEVGGRLKPLVALPGSSVFSLTDGDVIISAGQDMQPFAPLANTFNSITGSYPEPAQRWKSKDSPEIQVAGWLARDGQYLPMSVSYAAAPYKFQVQRLMQAGLLDAQRSIVHEFSLPPPAYALEPLDMISWTSSRNGYTAKNFIVEAITKLAGMGVQVVLKEVDPSDYDWSPASQLPTTIIPPTVEVPVYEVVTSFTAVGIAIQDDASNTRVAAVEIACSNDIAGIEDILIEIRKVGVTNPVVAVRRPFGTPFRWVVAGVAPATAYLVRIKPVSLYASGEWTSELTATTPNILVPRVGLAPDILAQIDTNITNTDAASLKLSQLTNGLVTAIDGALASIEARTRAGMRGWLTDPIFSRFTAGNLTLNYWWSRSGITAYGSQVAGLLGTALSIDVPAGTGVVQMIARSDVSTSGMTGVDPDAPFVVVVSQVEYILGDRNNSALRPEWSNDLTTWTRGDMQGLVASLGTFAQIGYALKPGVVQAFETLWKRPAGTFAYVRLVANPKTNAVTNATKQVWHLMQIRGATEAEASAWTIPTMQSTIDTQASTISGLGTSVATLTTDLASTNTLALGKGKVMIQSTTPAVADRLAQNLWIDTTGGANTPKMWNGSAWAQVTDKVATDAAAAAALAQGTADGITATLASSYLTAIQTNSAIAAVKTELNASIQPYQSQKLHSDFLFGDYYWAASFTQAVASLSAAAYPSVAYADITLPAVVGIGTVLQKGAGVTNRNLSERTHRPFVVGQKMRFRMKTRLTVNPTTGSHSTRLYFAMTDSAGAYLGISGIVANFLNTVVADGWVVKEVVFDPQALKAAGVYAATAVNWRMFIQLDGLNSAVQQVEWVEMEDVTTDTSLQASLTNILAVDVSSLTGTALAVLLTQLGVAAGGTSAWITSQTAAVADLEGNAAASFSLRVGAGGASAGLEIVATDNPISGPASTFKMSAKHIEILASSLRISDTGNVYPDFDMLDPLFYTTLNAAVIGFGGVSTATLGKKVLTVASNAALRSALSGWSPIEPSIEYLISGAAWMDAAGVGTASLYFDTSAVDAAGAPTGAVTSVLIATRTNLGFPGLLTAVSVVSGATARIGRFRMERTAGSAGTAVFGGLKIQKKAPGVLIANGAVFAHHVDTISFSASGLALFAGALQSTNYVAGVSGWRITNAGAAEVNSLSVRTDMIVNGAVTTVARFTENVTRELTSDVAWVEIGRLTINRTAGNQTDFNVSVIFDGYGNGLLQLGIFRGLAATAPLLTAVGNTIGGRQNNCSYAGVDPDTAAGATIYVLKARKVTAANTGGWTANLRSLRVYMSAQQFKK